MASTPSPKLRIRRLKVHGANRTRLSTIEGEFVGLFEATTMDAVVASLTSAVGTFESFGIFKHISIELVATGEPNVADVVIKVEEAGMPRLKVGFAGGELTCVIVYVRACVRVHCVHCLHCVHCVCFVCVLCVCACAHACACVRVLCV